MRVVDHGVRSQIYAHIYTHEHKELSSGLICRHTHHIHAYIHTHKHNQLAAILGGTHKVAGTVELRGKVAYAAQQPWIVNATVRDNVLFGAPYDEERYNKVIQACAMLADLKVLPSGDLTEIGEKVLIYVHTYIHTYINVNIHVCHAC